jgi:transposase
MDTNGSGPRQNRSWPEALKREIVAASYAPGSSVSKVARHYDVNANQVFAWRKRYRGGLLAPADLTAARMVPVTVMSEDPPDAVHALASVIEIDVGRGYRVRITGIVDGIALRRVLDVLEQR